MTIGENILKLRKDYKLSQEKFAELLDVSRQAVQKWESGESVPEIEKLVKISNKFSVSLDSLIMSRDKRLMQEFAQRKQIYPNADIFDIWELYSRALGVDFVQTLEEGKDIKRLEGLFKEVSKLPDSREKEKIADILFNMLLNASETEGYKYNEPSELEKIRLLRDKFVSDKNNLNTDNLKSKIQGAWMGRICGCLLGKPVEGIRTREFHEILKNSGNYPLGRYILSKDTDDVRYDNFSFPLKNRCYADTIDCAPVDDDTNYTVLYHILIEKYGRDFTPGDVLNIWIDMQGKRSYCTAERVAFCNFIKGYAPPESAIYKNPYREWIGAQIRADYFGYINPGDIETAADMAWRDASVSHVKNGIYGEMFVAAMIAYAAVCDDIEKIIMAGLSQIPNSSRLYEAIKSLLDGYKTGVTADECFAGIHKRFDEYSEHDWCHVISNAMIVAASLLYGKGDFGKSICMAVFQGFDTDCNGATVGSVLGMRNGIGSINEKWTKPVNGTLETTIFGFERVSIEEMAEKTIKHIKL